MKRLLCLAALCFTQSYCTTVTTIHTPKWQVEVSHNPLTKESVEVIATADGELIQARITKETDPTVSTVGGALIGAAATAAALK